MIIGITGSLGTGKTTVAKMFAAKGAKVIDADYLSHRALKAGTPVYKKIVSRFGGGIKKRGGSIDRRKLAGLVFNDRGRLEALTGIIHPFVIKNIKGLIKNSRPGAVVVIDAPLLIEAGLTPLLDKLVVVKADRGVQISRCVKKRKIKKEDAILRIKKQMPLQKKIRIADYVIDNNGTLKGTKKQVNEVWRELKIKNDQ